jgi:hypothetical protein
MKRLIYQVYVGKRSRLYDHCIESVEKYANAHDITHMTQTKPILKIRPDPFATNRSKEAVERLGYLPIYEKENAFNYFGEYDQIAIIDSDIWIRDGSPNIFDDLDSKYDFGGVVEREMPIEDWYKQKIINYSRMQYDQLHKGLPWEAKGIDFKPNQLGYEFFNMGLMVMNKSITKYMRGMNAQQFITQAQFKDFVDGLGAWKWSTDQTLLNYWVKKEKMKVKHMDWKWNGLFTANNRLRDCHFVHFFLKDKLPQQGENIEELMKHV